MRELPRAINYKQHFQVVINQRLLSVGYDQERRCFKLYDPKFGIIAKIIYWLFSWIKVGISSNDRIESYIKSNLDQYANPEDRYFTRISKNHFSIDARSLNCLLKNKAAVIATHDVSAAKLPDASGSFYFFKSLGARIPQECQEYAIKIRKHFLSFENDYVEITNALKAKLDNSVFFSKNSQGVYTNLTGEKFIILPSQEMNKFCLYSLAEGRELCQRLNPNILSQIKAISSEEPFVKYAKNGYYLNQQAYEKFAHNFISRAYNPTTLMIERLARNEEVEKNKLRKFLCDNRGRNSLSEDEFKSLEGRLYTSNGTYHFVNGGKQNFHISTSYGAPRSDEAFRGYLRGKCAIRMHQPYQLPLWPTWRKQMQFCHSKSKSAPVLVIDGGDDAATAITSSGLANRTALLIQILGLFPPFLALVNVGVQGLLGESKENKESLKELNQAIKACAVKVSNLRQKADMILRKKSVDKNYRLNQSEVSEIEDVVREACESVEELKSLFEDYHHSLADYRVANTGYAAMVSMFTAIASYELSSVSKLIYSFNHGSQIFNAATAFGVIGLSTAALGQSIMTCFAAAKSYDAYNQYLEIDEEMDNVRNSTILRDFTKKIILSYKQDEKLYQKLQLIGNASLSAGQAGMFVGGLSAISPLTFVGLGATLGGVAVNTAGTLFYNSRYGYNDEFDVADVEIKARNSKALYDFFVKQCTQKIVSSSRVNQRAQNFESGLSEIYSSNAARLDLLSAIKIVPMTLNKILAKAYEGDGVLTAVLELKKSSKLYSHKLAEQNFLNLLSRKTVDILENVKRNFRGKSSGYMLLWHKFIDELTLTEEDVDWIDSLSQLINKYRDGEIVRVGSIKLPSYILDSINMFNALVERNYENSIAVIQNAFLVERLSLVLKREHRYMRSDEVSLNKQVVRDMVGDDGFMARLMQSEYKTNNPSHFHVGKIRKEGHKRQGRYHDNSAPLGIVGTLNVEQEGMFGKDRKSKNVYELNEQYVMSYDYACRPDFIEKYMKTDVQYSLRSGYHRVVSEISANNQKYCQQDTHVQRFAENLQR